MAETELINCDFCHSEKDKNDVNVFNGRWKCGDCQYSEFKQQYEPILSMHNNSGNALIVENYPYGFRLRTKIRYWIETTKRGDRFVSQTLNPKTQRWNAEKKSTYTDVGILMQEKANSHITWHGWEVAYSHIQELERFIEFIGDYPLNELQRQKIKEGRAIYKTREHINIEIVDTTFENENEKAQREAKQEKVKHELTLIHHHYRREEGAI